MGSFMSEMVIETSSPQTSRILKLAPITIIRRAGSSDFLEDGGGRSPTNFAHKAQRASIVLRMRTRCCVRADRWSRFFSMQTGLTRSPMGRGQAANFAFMTFFACAADNG